jgi:hypothetical protein
MASRNRTLDELNGGCARENPDESIGESPGWARSGAFK